MGAYNVYLQSDHWKNFREKTINARKKCEHCGTEENLIVHHKSYLNLGNEKQEDVLVLCNECHKKVHMRKNSGKARFNRYGFNNYFKYITENVNDFTPREIVLLIKLSKCIDWDEGQLLYKKRKPVRYKDMLIISDCCESTLCNMLKSLREKDVLYCEKDGYHINPKTYNGNHKKMKPTLKDDSTVSD